jgi:hypothetical protein
MADRRAVGRFSVEFVVANNRDVLRLQPGNRMPNGVRHVVLSGVVQSGTARLVLPRRVVDERDLQDDGETTVRYADQRRLVSNVWLELLVRHGVFSAVVEPDRDDAQVGAIVLEELDLLVDCATQSLRPCEPDSILTEIE